MPGDPVRDAILALCGVDDPVSARDLPLPRLRFALADGPAASALDTAVARAWALAGMLRGPVSARVVCWSDAAPPLDRWFGAVTWDDRPVLDGAPRRIGTVEVLPDAAGLRAALDCALRGVEEIDLWLLDAEDVLLRPYDDRGADVVARSAALLTPFARRYGDWMIESSLTPRPRP